MSLRDAIVFVQQRAGKSGAPVALMRLMAHPALQELHPVLLAGAEGWLTGACRQQGVPFVTLPFPRSRTLLARFWGNRRFAAQAKARLEAEGFGPRLVIGNDHLEGLLARALARACGTPSAIFLRSSEMTRQDYLKYQCDRCEAVFSVGDFVFGHLQQWFPRGHAQLLYDGINAEEFLSPKPKAPQFPTRWLVVGSGNPDKGWQDFAAALDLLEEDPAFPALELDFTGDAPTHPQTNMHLERPRRSRLNFIGRQEKFRELLRQYDLVLHPSREEAFGLAMVESLAAGVPTITSRAGVIEKIQTQPELLLPCQDPAGQARAMRRLWQQWPAVDFRLAECQENIRRQFSMEVIAARFAVECRRLMG
jgi:glycosyltransferase involved in cell wall biosynthesis